MEFSYAIYINLKKGSNVFIFCVFIIFLFLKTLISQNLKFKNQNTTFKYDLHHFIYARVNIMTL